MRGSTTRSRGDWPRGAAVQNELLKNSGVRANKNALVTRGGARSRVDRQHVAETVRQGTDMVVNLAAGLDTRPYRHDGDPLRSVSLKVEVDLPGDAAEGDKADALSGEHPVCALERIPCDLADPLARRALFERLGARAKSAFIITEGLLVYLTDDEVIAFAEDLGRQTSFGWWVIDLMSPRLLRMLQHGMGSQLGEAGAPLKFAPEQGPEFFAQHGWKPVEVRSLLHEAAKLKRLPLRMRPLSWLRDTQGATPNRPWGGVCLLARSSTER